MSTDPAFVDLLTDLLKRAEVAHLAYQEQNGPVPDWPQFYAAHMAQSIGEQYREEDILAALLSAASAHGIHEKETGEHDAEWAHWYAEHMAARLSRDWYVQAADDELGWDG